MKTGDRETEDADAPRENSSSSDTSENVIRLPREWIGPLEDLVPIRPPTPDSSHLDGGGADDLPPTADAFWSEDAGALHNAVQAPDRGAPASGADTAVHTHHRSLPRFRPRPAHVPLRHLGAAAIGVALVAMAVIGTLWTSDRPQKPAPPGTSEQAQAASVQHQQGSISNPQALARHGRRTSRSPRASARHHGRRPARARRHRAGHAARAHTRTEASARSSGSAASGTGTAEPIASPSRPTTVAPATASPTNESTSTPPHAATAPPTGTRSSGNASSPSPAPAFGSSGVLGPGSSPNS